MTALYQVALMASSGTLVVSGLAKSADLRQFVSLLRTVARYSVASWVLAVILSAMELALGVGLCWRDAPVFVYGSVGIWVAFAAIKAALVLRRVDGPCYCFGPLLRETASWPDVGWDVAMVVCSLLTVTHHSWVITGFVNRMLAATSVGMLVVLGMTLRPVVRIWRRYFQGTPLPNSDEQEGLLS